MGAFAAGLWGTLLRPAAFEVQGEFVASAPGVVLVRHQAVAALGIANGPSYTQVLAGPDGPRVGELAARLGGGHDAELCLEALGVDLNALALSAAFGETVEEGRLRPAVRARWPEALAAGDPYFNPNLATDATIPRLGAAVYGRSPRWG